MNAVPDLSLTVLRRQMDAMKRSASNVHNLACSMFKADMEVKYRLNQRDYFGRVVEVIGTPGFTRVRVVNIATGRQRDLSLHDIIGLVQEN